MSTQTVPDSSRIASPIRSAGQSKWTSPDPVRYTTRILGTETLGGTGSAFVVMMLSSRRG